MKSELDSLGELAWHLAGKLRPADLDRSIAFFTMMTRQAGGRRSPVFGPTRETMPLRKPA